MLFGRLVQAQINAGHVIGGEIPLKTLLDLFHEAGTQVLGRQLHRLQTHAVGHVVAINNEVPAAVGFAPNQEVQMRIVGVVMRHPQPL